MKKSEYESIIKDLSNPDKVAEAILSLSDKLTQDESEYNTLIDSNNTLKTSNDTLRDTNAKLALRVTSTVENLKENNEQERDYYKELEQDILEGLENG